MEDSVANGDSNPSNDCNQDDDCNSCLEFDLENEMELNLADTLLELDSEDIADIYHMVSEWEFNFGSLEGSDTEELLALVHLENSQHPTPASTSSCQGIVPTSVNSSDDSDSTPANDSNELHDRLPSYYTALAPSHSAPWIQPANQVFNKLPAYITDVASLDVDVLTGGPSEEHRPGKKKLNLAEYRTRREIQLREQQQQEQQQEPVPLDIKEEMDVKVQVPQVTGDEVKEECDHKLFEKAVKEEDCVDVEPDTKGPEVQKIVKDDKCEAATSSTAASYSPPCRRDARRSCRKSSRSPTRSYSSRSSRSRSPSPPRRRRQRSSSRSSRSSYSSRSRSRSPSPRSHRRRSSRSRSRSWRRNRSYSQRRSRSPSPKCRYSDRRRVPYDYREAERQRQIEERRVIYVGKIPEGTTRADLRRRFEIFGPVVDVSLHFRDRGDNYGFVTFAYKVDAYEAVEHGNDDPSLPKFDLSFGGRRAFCKEQYADLDAADEDRGPKANDVDFETLLRAVQAQLHRRPCS